MALGAIETDRVRVPLCRNVREMLTVGEKLIISHNGKKHAFTINRFKDRSVVMSVHWNFTDTTTPDTGKPDGGAR